MPSRQQIQRLQRIINGDYLYLPKAVRSAAQKLHQAAQGWLDQEGVQGIGIGKREVAGQPTDELTLKVYVERKLPVEQAETPIPRSAQLPGSDIEIGIDVEEVGKIELQNVLTERSRPAFGGCSVSLRRGLSGTLGCLVRRVGIADLFYILSSSHVIGDFGLASSGTAVYQPGNDHEPASSQNRLGIFSRAVSFRFTKSSYPNLCDAAIARVPKAAVLPVIFRLGIPTGVNYILKRDMRVGLVGSGSGPQGVSSRIKDIDHEIAFRWKAPGGKKLRAGFDQQVACPGFTRDGDSGAAVLDSKGRVVGIHFAASNGLSIFNRIAPIEDQLGIEVVTRQNLDPAMFDLEEWPPLDEIETAEPQPQS